MALEPNRPQDGKVYPTLLEIALPSRDRSLCSHGHGSTSAMHTHTFFSDEVWANRIHLNVRAALGRHEHPNLSRLADLQVRESATRLATISFEIGRVSCPKSCDFSRHFRGIARILANSGGCELRADKRANCKRHCLLRGRAGTAALSGSTVPAPTSSPQRRCAHTSCRVGGW